ncbi:hypothetical protein FB391_3831 [Microbacterium kyungheense]|uniref:Uncharacterized protein n=1 Tax=Microbacterium kyungheense TaxID=1263636 RepID=A0A543EAX4_9MICO|nr:hypothetical protein FB391_3831 [Microbacterium kyungheense]
MNGPALQVRGRRNAGHTQTFHVKHQLPSGAGPRTVAAVRTAGEFFSPQAAAFPGAGALTSVSDERSRWPTSEKGPLDGRSNCPRCAPGCRPVHRAGVRLPLVCAIGAVRCARSPPGVLHRASCTGRPAPGVLHRASCTGRPAPGVLRRVFRSGCSAQGAPQRVPRTGCPTSGCATPRAHPPWSRVCVRPAGVPTQCPGAGAFARVRSRTNNVDQTAAVLPIGDPVRWCRGRYWLRPLTPPLRAVDAPRNSLAHTLPSGSSPRGFRRSRIVRSWFIRAPRARRCIGRGREVKEHSVTVVHRGVRLFHVKQPRRRRSTTRSNLASRFLSGSHEGHGALASRPT